MFIYLLILLVIAIILEGAVTNLPLTLLCVLCLTILKRDASVFSIAFFAGLFLDVFGLRQLGGTSIFFLSFVLMILLYQRKYEIYSYQFVMVAAFLGALFFLVIFGYKNPIVLALMSSAIGAILFACIRIFDRYQLENRHHELHYSK